MAFGFNIDLNVLNHLGLSLYSSTPAVLTEIVSNAWDADATEVYINVDADKNEITIKDNGHGMNADDIRGKFLNVGYARRTDGRAKTPLYKRDVMGRKGIGKLAMFGLANKVSIYTKKQDESVIGLKVDVQNIYFSLLPEVDPTTALKIAQLREKNIQWFEPISKKELNGHKELEDDVSKLNKELLRNRKYYKMLDEIVSVENNSRTPQFEGKTFVVGETSFFSPDYYCVIIALNGGTYQKDYLTFPLENADFILGDLENEEERMFKKIKSNKTMPKKITESMFRSIIPMLYAKSKYKINLINNRKEYLKLVGNDE